MRFSPNSLPAALLWSSLGAATGLAAASASESESTLVKWAPDYLAPGLTWSFTPPTARAEGKPVFVHLGAFGQELSRAMAKQSFSSTAVSEPLQSHFDLVLLDRDEWPEWAALAQGYLAFVKQGGGWPANLWLTPSGKPFEGAAYLPPTQEWGGEGIRNVIDRAAQQWEQSAADVELQAGEAVALLTTPVASPAPVAKSTVSEHLQTSAQAWLAVFDATNGGFGEAPRTAEPELLRFLLRREGDARQAALFTLDRLSACGLRTPEGGVYRRATEATWDNPVKLIFAADQARLALAYFDAHQLTGNAKYQAEALKLLGFLVAQLQRADGGFSRGFDATQPDGAPVFRDDRAFADDNGLIAHALAAAGGQKAPGALGAAYSRLQTYLEKLPSPQGAWLRRAGGSAPATLQDVVWASSALTLAGSKVGREAFAQLATDYYDASLHRLRVIPAKVATLPWSLPPVPPGTGDSPSAEASLLLASAAAQLPLPAAFADLAAHSLLNDINPLPRGDLLLALALQP